MDTRPPKALGMQKRRTCTTTPASRTRSGAIKSEGGKVRYIFNRVGASRQRDRESETKEEKKHFAKDVKKIKTKKIGDFFLPLATYAT